MYYLSESWVSLTNEKYWEGLSAHSEMENGFSGIEKLSRGKVFYLNIIELLAWILMKGIPINN